MKIYENLKNEIWREIEGYDGDYFVSNYGRIRSLKSRIEIILKQNKNHGYSYINLYKNGKKKTKQIHILMFEHFIGEIPEGYIVHHKDFTKNNRLDNFQLMDKKEHNNLHMKGKKHPMYGKFHSEKTKELISKNNPNSTLKEQDIIQIRKYLLDGILTQKEIGKLFGVNQTTISRIKSIKIWKHINEKEI